MSDLTLPEDRAVTVYKNVVKILRSDDVLSGVIQTWQLGEEGEEQWVAPTETVLPCLRLVPNVMRMQQADEEAYIETLEILFDFTVNGVNRGSHEPLECDPQRLLDFQAGDAQTTCGRYGDPRWVDHAQRDASMRVFVVPLGDAGDLSI